MRQHSCPCNPLNPCLICCENRKNILPIRTIRGLIFMPSWWPPRGLGDCVKPLLSSPGSTASRRQPRSRPATEPCGVTAKRPRATDPPAWFRCVIPAAQIKDLCPRKLIIARLVRIGIRLSDQRGRFCSPSSSSGSTRGSPSACTAPNYPGFPVRQMLGQGPGMTLRERFRPIGRLILTHMRLVRAI
jgi:hypothetical protein